MNEKPPEKSIPVPKQAGTQATRPAPPIQPNPKLDQLVEKGGPKKVPLPEWLKRLA